MKRSHWRGFGAALAAWIVVWLPGVAAAQEEVVEATKAAQETSIPGGQLAVISYIVLWGGLLAFVGYLGWRQRKLYAEMDELEGRLDEALGADLDETPED